MGKELFTNIPSKVKNLVDDVRIGKIGLPDLSASIKAFAARKIDILP